MARLDLPMASSMAALVRMFSNDWLMRRSEEGSGWVLKNASISLALSAVQKRPMEVTIIAAMREGEAFANMVLIKSKFCG